MPDDSAHLPELLADLMAKLEPEIAACGIDGQPARAAARRVIDVIRREWGGRQLYIPRALSYDVAEMRRVIGETWTGTPRSTDELCRHFDISDRRLRQLHAEYRAERATGNLF